MCFNLPLLALAAIRLAEKGECENEEANALPFSRFMDTHSMCGGVRAYVYRYLRGDSVQWFMIRAPRSPSYRDYIGKIWKTFGYMDNRYQTLRTRIARKPRGWKEIDFIFLNCVRTRPFCPRGGSCCSFMGKMWFGPEPS